MKIEKDGCLQFLDILLSHEPESSVWTSVFHKPTHTGRYLHFSSHHPLSLKMSVVRILFSRASFLSSSLVEHSVEEEHVARALMSNGYPAQFIPKSLRYANMANSGVYYFFYYQLAVHSRSVRFY